MSKSSRLQAFSFSHILTGVSAASILFAAALLLSSVFTGSALAEELNGANVEITAAGSWNTSYNNKYVDENDEPVQMSTITIHELVAGTRYDYQGILTGNIAVDITHNGYTNNGNRVVLKKGENSFTGGVTMRNGILFLENADQIASLNSGLTLDNGVLMAFSTFENTLKIADGKFGGLRASGGGLTQAGGISGSGNLVIVTDSNTVTLSGENAYTGVTSIGTIQGGANKSAWLKLDADNTLPSTTVVEIGESQNGNYKYKTPSGSTANFNLNGKTQTIAGLYGSGVATITNSSKSESNLTINLAEGTNFVYSGTIAGYDSSNLTNLTVTGAGNQTLSGNISNASITKEGTGTLTLGADSVSLASLAVNEGTLAFTPNVALTVSGKITLSDSSNTLNLNGADLTYTTNDVANFNNINIDNTNASTQSVLTIKTSGNVSQPTFNKKISGNTRLVVNLYNNENNDNRLILSNTSNDFTGGLYIEQGTVRVDNTNSLGSSKQIDFKNGCLMTTQDFNGYTINLTGTDEGDRGAIRRTGTNSENFKAKITGNGSLEIVNDNTVILTNTSNDYKGKTYIGNYGWRSNGLSYGATLKLGASGVLPDTTVVQFGGGKVTGTQTLNLGGFAETVAGISDSGGKGVITSSAAATLTVNMNEDFLYAGKVTGSATLEKKGTGTLTITGANTGYLTVNGGTLILSGDNSGAQSITIGENGTFIPRGANSAATQINLQGGTLDCSSASLLVGSTITAATGDSTINIVGPESGTYSRQLLTGTSKDMTYFTAPEFISNMDLIANTAYASGTYAADIWGDKSKDQNNTNLLQTSVVNTTDSPITLDFAYQFHNSAYLAVIDSEGNRTVVMDWTNTASHTVDGGTYSFASNTGSYTFEPGETYTIEARIFRFNRTIGANGGGVNGFSGTLVGLGARVSGTDGEYLPLNFDGDNWTFSDGSFTFSNQVNFSAPVTINSEASLTFNVSNSGLAVSSAVSGAGTLNVNPAEGFTHTYSGAIADTVVIAKSGEGTMTLSGDCQSIGSVTVGAGTLDVAFDNVSTELNIDSIAMAENTAFKVTQGTVTFGQTDVVLNNLSGDNGVISVDGVLTLNNDQLTKYVGAISAQKIKKTGDETLQVYAAAEGMVSASSFVVSSGRLDMKDYFTGSLEVGENLGNGSYTTAVLSPGNSVGTLTVNGDYTLNPGSTLFIEIGKDDQGNVVADKLIVNGDATFMPGSIIDITLDDASSLVGGETFEGVIITADNAASIFNDVKAAIRSYYFDITVTQSGNNILLSAKLDPNVVPEPSTWALLALGAAGLMYMRKRK